MPIATARTGFDAPQSPPEPFALWNEARRFLEIAYEGIPTKGSKINKDEEFELKIIVRNTAPTGWDVPAVRFKNLILKVFGSNYTTPVGASGGFHIAKKSVLDRTGASEWENTFLMLATHEIEDYYTDLYVSEFLADIDLTADLDIDNYFKVKRKLSLPGVSITT